MQDRIQLALAHEHVHVLAQAGLRKQILNIGQARRGAVNLVLAAAGTEHGARNLHPISGNAEGAVRIVEGQRHLGATQGCTLGAVARASKDDVLHAAAAQALGALLAHDPGERIQHIGFAGAVRAHHGVNAGGELEGRGRGERLEPAQGQRHQVHKGPFCRRRCRNRDAAAVKPAGSNLQVEPFRCTGGIPLVYAVRDPPGAYARGERGRPEQEIGGGLLRAMRYIGREHMTSAGKQHASPLLCMHPLTSTSKAHIVECIRR